MDFTPSNILLRTSDLDGLTEKEVIEALGIPKKVKVVTVSGESSTDPAAPRYLVYPVDFYKVDSRFVTDQACIIDFGESFEASNPPEDLGTPEIYCSPELILDKVAGIGSDLWALGCTVFEIRTGRKLFNMFDDDVDDHLYYMVLLFGKLPEPWWTTWEAHKDCFEDEANPQGRAVKSSPATEQPPAQDPDKWGLNNSSVVYQPRSIQESLAPGLWYQNKDIGKEIHRNIPGDEIEVFADLLGKILNYDPSARLTANAAQDHEWFKM